MLAHGEIDEPDEPEIETPPSDWNWPSLGPDRVLVVRVTDRARKVVQLANGKARRSGQREIGTEHLLLEILKEVRGGAANVLKYLGVDLQKIRSEAEKFVHPGVDAVGAIRPSETHSAIMMLGYALEEAKAFRHNHLGTEHLLLGLIREAKGVAAQILLNAGLTLEKVRAEAVNVLANGLGDGAPDTNKPKNRLPKFDPPSASSAGGLYTRYTLPVRKVLTALSDEQAERFNHDYIGTEHFLLGLLQEDNCVAAKVLKNLNVDLRAIQTAVEDLIIQGPDLLEMGRRPLTQCAKNVVHFAVNEASNLNRDYVGTEHILFGLLRELEGVAAEVLMSFGLTLQRVRAEALNTLRDSPPEEI